ncbi:DUF6265 family protein [Hyphobacterium marinum]|uniref:DUF6265 family protein n=1 Tax=Hyphobacterium marinum TaxID=3116574 RepID=A0ABU7LVC9_9PROT|nr:DUF6265 family protein [Hyphobacterium sp. Y6023]MEE2565508.1 DUF6265 family protein [Hyphobacterium sp. Y6023]
MVEDSWTSDEGHLLLGTNRTFVDGEVRAFEFLRIAYSDAGEGEYCAQPGGGAATCFALVESGDGFAIFENPDPRRPPAHPLCVRR